MVAHGSPASVERAATASAHLAAFSNRNTCLNPDSTVSFFPDAASDEMLLSFTDSVEADVLDIQSSVATYLQQPRGKRLMPQCT